MGESELMLVNVTLIVRMLLLKACKGYQCCKHGLELANILLRMRILTLSLRIIPSSVCILTSCGPTNQLAKKLVNSLTVSLARLLNAKR